MAKARTKTTTTELVAGPSANALTAGGMDPVTFSKAMCKAYGSVAGVDSVDQAEGIALTGFCEGLNPVQFAKRYHWIPGKGPSMQAAAMLAEFRMNFGGDYKVVEDSDVLCHIEFTDFAGRVYDRRMTRLDLLLSRNPWAKAPGWKQMVPKVEEMAKAGMPDDEIYREVRKSLSDNYATAMDWQNMLFARLCSSSLRRICPELAAGVYTPEELNDVATPQPVAATAPTAQDFLDEDVEDVPFETVSDLTKKLELPESQDDHPDLNLAMEVEAMIFDVFPKKLAEEKLKALLNGEELLVDLGPDRLEEVRDKLLAVSQKATAKN